MINISGMSTTVTIIPQSKLVDQCNLYLFQCFELGVYGGQVAYHGMGSGDIWMDEVDCTNNDTYLAQCNHNGWGVHDCSHEEDIGITCGESDCCHQIP